MLKEELKLNAFDFFKELFKNPNKQAQLFYLLTATPSISAELLIELVTPLEDKVLLTLIANLLEKSEQNSEFKKTLNQVLLIFCQKLYHDQNLNSAIHQWNKEPFVAKLVDALLNNPDCVYQLSMTFSTLYAWVTWTNTANALKHRIDALLNYQALDETRIKELTL